MHSLSCFETQRTGARLWKDLRSRRAALLLSMRAHPLRTMSAASRVNPTCGAKSGQSTRFSSSS